MEKSKIQHNDWTQFKNVLDWVLISENFASLLEIIILLSIYYFFNPSSDFICDFWTKTNFSIKLKIENFKNKNLRVTNGMKKRRENHAVEHVVKTWHKCFVVNVSI